MEIQILKFKEDMENLNGKAIRSNWSNDKDFSSIFQSLINIFPSKHIL